MEKLCEIITWLKDNPRGAFGCFALGVFAALILVTITTPEVATVVK